MTKPTTSHTDWKFDRETSRLATEGLQHIQSSRHNDGIKVLEKLSKLSPSNPWSWCFLGIAYSRAGREADATEAYNHVVEIILDVGKVQRMYGEAYTRMELFDAAKHEFEVALYYDDKDAYSLVNLATLFDREGKNEAAIRFSKRAVESEPTNPDYWLFLGQLYQKANYTNLSIAAQEQAVSLKPDFTVAWLHLGYAYEKGFRMQDAIKSYLRAVDLAPQDADARHRLGRALLKEKKFTEAIDSFQQSLRIKADFVQAMTDLGVAYEGLGRMKEALSMHRKATKLSANYAYGWYSLGWCLLRMGDKNGAIDALEVSAKLKPNDLYTWWVLFDIFSQIGQPEKAHVAFVQIERIDPTFAAGIRHLTPAIWKHLENDNFQGTPPDSVLPKSTEPKDKTTK